MDSALVAVVYHSDPEALSECISSILESVAADRVVVFDTSSSGEARCVVHACGVTWRDGSRNAGYAWALSQVAEEWAGRFDVFVASNSDVRFLDAAVARLVAHARELRGVCYALQKQKGGTVGRYSVQPQLSRADAVARWLGPGRRSIGSIAQSTVECAIESVAPEMIPAGYAGSGAVIAVPADVWVASGGLDRDYFLFEEDRSFGTRLEELGVRAYLCGDCVVQHDGGFSSRGLTVAGTLECVISEQIAWKKHRVGSGILLWTLQAVGLVGRVAVAVVRSRPRDRRVYVSVLSAHIGRACRRGAHLYGPDGLRVPATQMGGVRR